MKRIAVYGGSFNPIHLGHIALARHVLRERLADEVWLMVSPCNPLKVAADLLDTADRLRLARLAVAEEPGIVVSDFETRLPLPSYTYLTLRALRRDYPEVVFSLLIGADNWAAFSRWAHPDEILRHHAILVYPREGCPLDAASFPPNVTLIDAPLFPYSSTDIRQGLREGSDVSGMVSPPVLAAIKEAHLYGAGH